MRYEDIFDGETFKPEYSGGYGVDVKSPLILKAIELYNKEQMVQREDLDEDEHEYYPLVDAEKLANQDFMGVSGDNLHWVEYAKSVMIEEILRANNVDEKIITKIKSL